MTSRVLLPVLALGLISSLAAQTGNLRLNVTVGGVTQAISNGSTVPVRSDGRDAIVSLAVANGGNSTITVTQLNISTSDFSFTNGIVLPLNLAPGGSLFFNVGYRPVSGRSSSGTVTIAYTEVNQPRTFSFVLSGTAPEYAFFITTVEGTRAALTAGSKITFPITRLGSSRTQTLIVANTGSVPGMIMAVSVTGTTFSTSGPTISVIPAGQEIAIPVAFVPSVRGVNTGTITLNLGATTAMFALEGTGGAPEFVVAYALRSDGNTRPITNDGHLTFSPTAATTTATAEVIIGNQGNAVGSIRSVSLTGTPFTLAALPLLPVSVEAGQAVRFQVLFNPRQLGSYSGMLRIELDDRNVNVTVEGTTSNPAFTLSYIDPVSRNTVSVPEGGQIPFPPTNVDNTLTYVISLRNGGEGTGFITAISVSGQAFQLVDIPSLPVTLAPGSELRVGLRFAPKQRQTELGLLRFEVSNGSLLLPLSGTGIGAALSFEVTDSDGMTTPVAVGSELTFVSAVRQTASKTIHIANTGSSDAQISSITITGTGFTLEHLPFLPASIPPSGAQTLVVNFTPLQPGLVRGRLRIGDQIFDLAGTGIAPRLEFSYTNQAGTTELSENQAVVLTPARIGESSAVSFSIRNTGTSAIAISTIDIGPSTLFAIENSPALPLSLDAGSSVQFGVRFAPNNTGNLSGTLRINNTVVNLVGAGRTPVPLPEQRIEGPSGVQEPMQQPAVGVSLASAYSLPLRGSLALSFVSDVFSENPAIQFATGGRNINFTIPANSTRAVFDNGSIEVRLQTGTVAGSLQLRPTFMTQAGLDLTPESPATLVLTINRAAPRLLTAEISGPSANVVGIVVTGYSTTRSLRQVDVRLTSRRDQKLSTTVLTQSVESASLVWFQTTTSQALGGLFSMTIPLTLQRGNSTENLFQYLQSVSITVSNEVGSSNSKEVIF